MTSASAATVPPSTPSSTSISCSNSNAGNTTPTPPVRHNYANPHTPIASVKRPRSSVTTTNNNNYAASKLSPLHPPRPVSGRTVVDEEEAIVITTTAPPEATVTDTDCHNNSDADVDPAASSSSTWVGRQVDALFSPVLNFLHHNSTTRQNDHLPMTPTSSSSEEEDVAAVTDEDVTMEDVAAGTGTVEKEEEIVHLHEPQPPTVVVNAQEEEEEPVMAKEEEEEEEEPHEPDTVAETSSTETSVDVDDEDEFNPYLFIKSLPPYELVAPFRPPVALPPKSPQAPPISLILDLDETLVHCSVEGTCPTALNSSDPPPPPDLVFPVLFHGMTYQVQVRLRPHLFTFLEAIAQKFEVVVFTASQKVYADELLNLLDPDNKYIHHRLFRESCLPVEGNFLKDLNVLGRDLRQTVLVDNSPHAFGYQIDNGIPIESWFEDPHDTELLKLEQFLSNQLLGSEDVRSVVRQQFRTFQRVEQA